MWWLWEESEEEEKEGKEGERGNEGTGDLGTDKSKSNAGTRPRMPDLELRATVSLDAPCLLRRCRRDCTHNIPFSVPWREHNAG